MNGTKYGLQTKGLVCNKKTAKLEDAIKFTILFFIFIRSNVMKKQYEENITKGLLYINTISRFPSNTTNKIVKNISVDRNNEK